MGKVKSKFIFIHFLDSCVIQNPDVSHTTGSSIRIIGIRNHSPHATPAKRFWFPERSRNIILWFGCPVFYVNIVYNIDVKRSPDINLERALSTLAEGFCKTDHRKIIS